MVAFSFSTSAPVPCALLPHTATPHPSYSNARFSVLAHTFGQLPMNCFQASSNRQYPKSRLSGLYALFQQFSLPFPLSKR